MPYKVQLAGSSAPAPAFGLGTAHYAKRGDNGVNAELKQSVLDALKAGFRHIDLAEGYNNTESFGAALAEANISRDQLFITDKLAAGIKDVRGTLTASLKKAGIDYVDLFLIHDPTAAGKAGLSQAEAWRQMEAVHREGLAKAIGVSNYRQRHLEELLAEAEIKPAANQIEVHPLVHNDNEPLLAFCKEQGIVVEAYSPLVPLTKATGTPVETIAKRIAKERSITDTLVLFLWAKHAISDGIVVTTSAKPERMADQLKLGSIDPLTDAEIKELTDAGKAEPTRRIYMGHSV